jgi:hypothetical protein
MTSRRGAKVRASREYWYSWSVATVVRRALAAWSVEHWWPGSLAITSTRMHEEHGRETSVWSWMTLPLTATVLIRVSRPLYPRPAGIIDDESCTAALIECLSVGSSSISKSTGT